MADNNGAEFHDDDFGDHFGQPAHTESPTTGHEGDHHTQPQTQENQAQPAATNFDDDFFSSEPQPQGGSNVQFGSNQPVFDMPQAQPMGGMSAFNAEYDPEEEERQDRLRKLEQQRIEMLDEKANTEREKKQEKIADAARELAHWHSEREQTIEKRRQINRQNQQLQNETNAEDEYKNSWDKIVANIATKEGEYPGTKDVTRFRQALINKKNDAAKGLGQDLGF